MIYLPKRVDPEQVKAEFRDGMVKLTAPIAQDAERKKVRLEAA